MRYVPISYGASRIVAAPPTTSGGAAVRTMSSPVLPRARSPSRRSTERASSVGRANRSVADAGSREGLRIEGVPCRVAAAAPRGREPLADLSRRAWQRHLATERHDAVAIRALADALRARRHESRPRVPLPFGEVAARQEPHRPEQRDRDRPSVVKHRVLAETIDADSDTTRRSLDGHEVVERALGGRLLDPTGARRDARLAL